MATQTRQRIAYVTRSVSDITIINHTLGALRSHTTFVIYYARTQILIPFRKLYYGLSISLQFSNYIIQRKWKNLKTNIGFQPKRILVEGTLTLRKNRVILILAKFDWNNRQKCKVSWVSDSVSKICYSLDEMEVWRFSRFQLLARNNFLTSQFNFHKF